MGGFNFSQPLNEAYDDTHDVYAKSSNIFTRFFEPFMSGLADELLADLEDNSGGEEQEQQQLVHSEPNAFKRKAVDSDHDMSAEDDDEQPDDPDSKRLEVGALVLDGGIKPAEELDVEDVQRMELGAIEDVNKIAKLEGSKRMTDILKVCPPFSILTQF